jgi:hypothetical protein
MFFQTSYTP